MIFHIYITPAHVTRFATILDFFKNSIYIITKQYFQAILYIDNLMIFIVNKMHYYVQISSNLYTIMTIKFPNLLVCAHHLGLYTIYFQLASEYEVLCSFIYNVFNMDIFTDDIMKKSPLFFSLSVSTHF